MARIRVHVLGAARLEIDSQPFRLTPQAVRLLVRLVAAEGRPVSVKVLRQDVWGQLDPPRQARRGRNEVQKKVLELRRALDGAQPGLGTELLVTERLLTGVAPESAYRLALRPEQLDCAEFAQLVNQALREPPVPAAQMLTRAVALWDGSPLAEAGHAEYAAPLVRRLTGLYESARRELIRVHTMLGRLDLAVPIAERMVEENTDDVVAQVTLESLRARLRDAHGDEILRRRLRGLNTEVALIRGDLFDQDDANLVVGFTDTFDTVTRQDYVINHDSVQGQLVDRLFGGRSEELDALLRRGLRQSAPVAQESRSSKPKGKLTRYPLGTVVPLTVGGRRVFATAYSRLGNDLVARASVHGLRESLERLWEAVALHGQYRPVAVPVVGSGLARIPGLSREEFIAVIVDTFLRSCQKNSAVAPQLRIVVRPADLERTALSDVARYLEAFDDDGFAPGGER